MLKTTLTVLITLLTFQTLRAADVYSMRRCVLLPITDSVGGAIGADVYDQVEKFIKQDNWCHYRSASGLLNVFSRYRENLPQHLETKEVLKVVADKLQAGSLIRVNLKNEIDGIEVSLDIIGGDGETLLFSEKSLVNNGDIDLIVQNIRNWLAIYAKIIPYDGKITGILGDQITLDIGKTYPISIGNEIIVKRLKKEIKHPLLKKVVEWDAISLATGKIFNISENQALAVIKIYRSEEKLRIGDWVTIDQASQSREGQLKFAKNKSYKVGSLGEGSAYLLMSSSSLSSSDTSSSRRLGGSLVGFTLRGEGWITRNYFVNGEITRSFGSFKKNSGTATKSTYNTKYNTFKIGGGYKYLPLGFFYGPQVNFFGGYSFYTFSPESSPSDALGEAEFSGFHLGVNGSAPFKKIYRGFIRAEFIPFPSFGDSDGVYGGAKSASVLQLELGVRYKYNSSLSFDGSLELTSADAKFNGNVKNFSSQNSILRLGGTLAF